MLIRSSLYEIDQALVAVLVSSVSQIVLPLITLGMLGFMGGIRVS
jgi:hypothetical protein